METSSPNSKPTPNKSLSSSEQRELDFQARLEHREWLSLRPTRELLAHLNRRREALVVKAEQQAALCNHSDAANFLLAARELRLLTQNINDGKYNE